jgi:molybdopterin-containing oxidoreductase family iron-sulfur binding subunit
MNANSGNHGNPFWRTLGELRREPAFEARLHDEFVSPLDPPPADGVARRQFLKVMGASIALAGAAACTRQPPEDIVPYVQQPEEIVPGRPLFFATTYPGPDGAVGLLVESHEGHPTKIEGNPLHPASLGAAGVFEQASILDLYDPGRAQTVTQLGLIRTWSSFLGAMSTALAVVRPRRGAGLRILTERVMSPSLAARIRTVLAAYPAARWHQWSPAGPHHARAGARLAFGRAVAPIYHLDRADVVLTLDADLVGSGEGWIRYARDFAARRRPEDPGRMSRLYALESTPSLTGAKADHRFPARPSEIAIVARAIAAAVGAGSAGAQAPQGWDRRVAAIAADLTGHRGSSLVVAGEGQPPAVHALAHAMNEALGNAGATVEYIAPPEIEPIDEVESLRALTSDMQAGRVNTLVILGGNPVYTAPADIPFGAAMSDVPLRVHVGHVAGETSSLCHWQIPESHYLESWSDARAFDGTASIVQPLIAPLYDSRTPLQVVTALTDSPEQTDYDLIRAYWSGAAPGGGDFEPRWRRWVHDGLIEGTGAAAETVTVDHTAVAAAASALEPAAGGIELIVRTDPSIHDGRFANNGWLQEVPKPITRLAWGNAILMSPAMAAQLGVNVSPDRTGGEHGQIDADVVRITSDGRTIEGPAFAVAGHPDDAVTAHLGFGRARSGDVGTGVGFDAYQARVSGALWSVTGASAAAAGRQTTVACTQYHHLMEGRGMVRVADRDEYVRNPRSVHEGYEPPGDTNTLYPEWPYPGYKWGMAIDINACIGCNACVIACQSENNIPVVGKEQVQAGREMHWIRIDAYHRGPEANPETYFQPVPCMQCENAPCEVVCPVEATVHGAEGLNDMIYNRCVGTRYCSNNCPYKVRRFNFKLYADWSTPSLHPLRNPDVTVRSRGVMEKCTYCVQRINAGKIAAEEQDRPVRDGEIRPACQQTCPTQAIVFGDLNDRGSAVTGLQAEIRNYGLLVELNTRPRTTYLAAIRNPNADLSD